MSREFTWPLPMADSVYRTLHMWLVGYENGDPVNPRRVPHPNKSDEHVVICERYRHKKPFRLNELQWLSDTLNTENDETAPAKIMKKAVELHQNMQDEQKIGFGGEYFHEFDFAREEVQWMYNLLSVIRRGGRTPMQLKDSKKSIEDTKW